MIRHGECRNKRFCKSGIGDNKAKRRTQEPRLGRTDSIRNKKEEQKTNKSERIKRYGQDAWNKKLKQGREWRTKHPDEVVKASREYNKEQYRKGGKCYVKKREYERTGLQGERSRVRAKHRRMWSQYKKIIASGSQLHHQWEFKSSKYKGLALVETNQHQHGIIDVIQILEGEITLLTEKAIKNAR